MKDLMTLKTDFLTYLEIDKNRSQKTIENYDHYLSRFLVFLSDKSVNQPEKLTDQLISQFRLSLNRQSSLSKKTQDYHIIALRSFLRFLRKRGINTRPPESIELGRQPTRQVTFLEPEELERLLATTFTKDNGQPLGVIDYRDRATGVIDYRDRAIILTLFATGLRVSEIVSLNRDQINLETKEINILGKGGRSRIAFLSPVAAAAISDYTERRDDQDQALFIAHSLRSRSRITPRSVERMVKNRAKLAQIVKKVTPHVLRHTFATDLLRAGADLRSIQQLLGHASVTTTQIYTHVTDPHLKEIHRKFHGKNLGGS